MCKSATTVMDGPPKNLNVYHRCGSGLDNPPCRTMTLEDIRNLPIRDTIRRFCYYRPKKTHKGRASLHRRCSPHGVTVRRLG